MITMRTDYLTSWLRPARRNTKTLAAPGKRPLARPVLEYLESRDTPAVFIVNSIADGTPTTDGNLTLREAITAANTNAASGDAGPGDADGDTILFDSAVFVGTG